MPCPTDGGGAPFFRAAPQDFRVCLLLFLFLERSGMFGFMQTSFFFGYMLLAAYAAFIMLGTIGFISSLLLCCASIMRSSVIDGATPVTAVAERCKERTRRMCKCGHSPWTRAAPGARAGPPLLSSMLVGVLGSGYLCVLEPHTPKVWQNPLRAHVGHNFLWVPTAGSACSTASGLGPQQACVSPSGIRT